MKKELKAGFKQIIPWLFSLVRIAIGWHFLYEGISKIIASGWSSAPYLAGSRWIFAPLFHAMAESSAVTGVVDFLNIWGMILVGLGLMGSRRRHNDALILFRGLSPDPGIYVRGAGRGKLPVGE
jgi:hypothetical protein